MCPGGSLHSLLYQILKQLLQFHGLLLFILKTVQLEALVFFLALLRKCFAGARRSAGKVERAGHRCKYGAFPEFIRE
jgi:hypothetical protein